MILQYVGQGIAGTVTKSCVTEHDWWYHSLTTLGNSNITTYEDFAQKVIQRFDQKDPELYFKDLMLRFWGNIEYALALKLCGGAGTHEVSKTQVAFGEISSGVIVIQIIKIFNGDPKSNLGKLKN